MARVFRDRCPLCDSQELAIRWRLHHEAADYSLARCSACTFVFVQDPPTSTTDVGETVIHPTHFRHVQIKELVARHGGFQNRDRVVVHEVGAGTGALATLFREERFAYTGYEPSAFRAQYARENGCNVLPEMYGPQTVAERPDVVVMDNVLEHVLDPRELFAFISSRLNPGGIFVVIVPNLNDARNLIPSWRRANRFWPNCHVNYFTGSVLSREFRRHGLEPRAFPLSTCATLHPKYKVFNAAKILCDSVGLTLFGLYSYGVKPREAHRAGRTSAVHR